MTDEQKRGLIQQLGGALNVRSIYEQAGTALGSQDEEALMKLPDEVLEKLVRLATNVHKSAVAIHDLSSRL